MFETATTETNRQRNLLSWGSLVLALITIFIWVRELTVAVPYVVMLRTGPTAILGLLLGIAGVWKARALRCGRGIGIAGIVICSLFVLMFLIGLSVAIGDIGR
ncbi:MAG: hypothetical protein ABSH46_13255 [Bryobacteraceae bacterium]